MRNISFKGGNFKNDFILQKLDVVQDADRFQAQLAQLVLQELFFNYGGCKNGGNFHNPTIAPNLQMTKG